MRSLGIIGTWNRERGRDSVGALDTGCRRLWADIDRVPNSAFQELRGLYLPHNRYNAFPGHFA
jgi:hypothetical protein